MCISKTGLPCTFPVVRAGRGGRKYLRWVPFTAVKGSIIAKDARTWHTLGKQNVTVDQDRALVFGYYTKPVLRQQVNWTAAMGEYVKSELREQGRGLLGLNFTANTGTVSDVGIGLEEHRGRSCSSRFFAIGIHKSQNNTDVRGCFCHEDLVQSRCMDIGVLRCFTKSAILRKVHFHVSQLVPIWWLRCSWLAVSLSTASQAIE